MEVRTNRAFLLMFVFIALLFPYHIHINISESAGGEGKYCQKVRGVNDLTKTLPGAAAFIRLVSVIALRSLAVLKPVHPLSARHRHNGLNTPHPAPFFSPFFSDEPTVIGTERNDMAANLYQFHNRCCSSKNRRCVSVKIASASSAFITKQSGGI